jgi:hypothetical protein
VWAAGAIRVTTSPEICQPDRAAANQLFCCSVQAREIPGDSLCMRAFSTAFFYNNKFELPQPACGNPVQKTESL